MYGSNMFISEMSNSHVKWHALKFLKFPETCLIFLFGDPRNEMPGTFVKCRGKFFRVFPLTTRGSNFES